MSDIKLGDTIYRSFTSRAFATGIPTVLAGTPVMSIDEDDGLTPITAGITLTVSHNSVVGKNMVKIIATGGNGFESGKDYNIYISTGTVGGVSVVGEVVGHFSIERSAAAQDLANGTDGLGAIKAETALIKTEADKIALVDAGAGVTGSVIEEVENRPTNPILATDLNFSAGIVESNVKQIDDVGDNAVSLGIAISTDTDTVNSNLKSIDSAAKLDIAKAIKDQDVSGTAEVTGSVFIDLDRRLWNAVYQQSGSGNTGVTYPNGTPIKPVQGIDDAVSIANTNDLTEIYVSKTALFASNASDKTFRGNGQGKTGSINLNGVVITDCKFFNAEVEGSVSTGSKNQYDGCYMLVASLNPGVDDRFRRCTIGKQIDTQDKNLFVDCRFIAGAILDCGLLASDTIDIVGGEGDLSISSVGDAGTVVNVYGFKGDILLGAGSNFGTINLFGCFGKIVDSTTGATVNITRDDDQKAVLADTNEMQGKLPTNNFMGSGVKTDKDDEIDAILVDTSTTLDTKLNDLQTDSTAILADTNETQGKLPTNNIMGSSVKTDKDDEIDAIKAKTDNLPGDPASETNVNANETKIDLLQTDSTAILADTSNMQPKLGAITGSGDNTVLGFFKANLNKAAATPSDIGGTFAPADDSNEAIRDRGDADWSGATATWTATEKENIRKALGVDGTKTLGGVAGDLQDTLTDTNEIQGKLPDNNIMGSGVTTDKDDEIDAIKTAVDQKKFPNGAVYCDGVTQATTAYPAGELITPSDDIADALTISNTNNIDKIISSVDVIVETLDLTDKTLESGAGAGVGSRGTFGSGLKTLLRTTLRGWQMTTAGANGVSELSNYTECTIFPGTGIEDSTNDLFERCNFQGTGTINSGYSGKTSGSRFVRSHFEDLTLDMKDYAIGSTTIKDSTGILTVVDSGAVGATKVIEIDNFSGNITNTNTKSFVVKIRGGGGVLTIDVANNAGSTVIEGGDWKVVDNSAGGHTVTHQKPNGLAEILTDTDEIQGKLPDNNIMGSSVTTDKDDEIDAIKAKTDNLPADPASETNVNANETKIDAVKVDTAAIKAKTDNLPADPASETNVNANETKIDAVKVDTAAIKIKTDSLAFTGGNVHSHTKVQDDLALTAQQKLDVNAEVLDVSNVDTIPELAAATLLPKNPTERQAKMALYMALRNESNTTNTLFKIKNDAGAGVADQTLADDGTTLTRSKVVAGT